MRKNKIVVRLFVFILGICLLIIAGIVYFNSIYSQHVLLISALGSIVLATCILYILHWVLKPLTNISNEIKNFSFGNSLKPETKNEISSLQESLLELRARYKEILFKQIENKKDRERLEKDLKFAQQIQANITPSEYPAFPEIEEIDIYAIHRPAQIIGGDFFDYFFIDPNHLLFAIGDVSGKGIAASLFMTQAHTYIRSHSNAFSSKEISESLNKFLSRRNDNQQFITLFMAILNIKTGELDYCNAAHNYPYLIDNLENITLLDQTHGLPVGIYDNKEYKSSKTILKKGDLLLLYTDGVTDSSNENDLFYSTNNLEKNFHDIQDLNAMEVVQKIDNSLKQFSGTARQVDDISLLALRFI